MSVVVDQVCNGITKILQVVAVQCSDLFDGLSRSLKQLVDEKDQIAQELTQLYFSEGAPYFHLFAAKHHSIDFGVSSNANDNSLKQSSECGDLSVHIFFDRKSVPAIDSSGTHDVNRLEARLAFNGMISIDLIATYIKKVLNELSMAVPELSGSDVSDILARLVPEASRMMSGFLETTGTNFHLDNFTNTCGEQASILTVNAVVDLENMKKLYPSVEQALGHLRRVKLHILDPSTFPTKETISHRDEALDPTNAHILIAISLETRGSDCDIRVNLCLNKDSNQLLYMQPEGKERFKPAQADGKHLPIDFDMQESHRFVGNLNTDVKMMELGCATISLPEVFFEFVNHPTGDPLHEKLTLKILHITAHRRLVGVAMRPFLNIGLFRQLLIRDCEFTFQTKLSPSDPKTGLFSCDASMTLVPPKRVCSMCFRHFLSSQLTRMDMLRLLSDLFGHLSVDFKQFIVQ